MCAVFADTGRFQILGASADKPISIQAADLKGFKPWLAMLVKVFKINNYAVLATVVEWPRATVHWHADIYSKVTGTTVHTELVDILEVGEDRIVSYTEFFAPR